MAKAAILVGLSNTKFVKVMHCKLAKDLWDKLKNYYEGNDKIKEAKLQNYRGQFESLKMEEDENIASYFLCVDNVVNSITSLNVQS